MRIDKIMELKKRDSLLLYKLQLLDLKIFQIESKDVEKNLNEIQFEIKKTEEEVKKLSNNLKEKELEIKNIEGEIADLNKRGDKLKETLSSGKKLSEKELNSIQSEIDKIQNLIKKNEDIIIEIDEFIEKTKEKIKKQREVLDSKKKEGLNEDIKIKEEKKKLEIDKDEYIKKREELIKKIPEELLNFYQININRFGRKIISVVIEDRCSECGMILPYGLISILKNSDKSINCENCGRFLILKKDIDIDF